jgi:hypothetical protein
MAGIVLELQRLAADGTTSAGDLIRKARMVATKLKLADFNGWLGHELHGYPPEARVPDYRVLHGDLRARNPANGVLMPIRFGPELTETFSRGRLPRVGRKPRKVGERGIGESAGSIHAA